MPGTVNRKPKHWTSFEESLLDLAGLRQDSDDGLQDAIMVNAAPAAKRDTRTIDEILQDRAKSHERAARARDEARGFADRLGSPEETATEASNAQGVTVSLAPSEADERAARKYILEYLPSRYLTLLSLPEDAGCESDRSDAAAELEPQKAPMSETDAATSALASTGPEVPATSYSAATEEPNLPMAAWSLEVGHNRGSAGVFSGRKRPRSPDSSGFDNPPPFKRPSSDIAATVWALFGKERNDSIDRRGFGDEGSSDDPTISDGEIREVRKEGDAYEEREQGCEEEE